MNIQKLILKITKKALNTIGMESFTNLIKIQHTKKQKFGNYQINGLITIAKIKNIPSEKFIQTLTTSLHLNCIIEKIKIEPPGFINIFLNPKWIENQINFIFLSPRIGVSLIDAKKIIVDYSGPNIAKEMHVGHLRSTVIGDSIVRILSFLGHNVIRVNHIGDWGTQFGMLIAYIEKNKYSQCLFQKNISFSILENFYQKAKIEYDNDSNFAELSRNYVVKLQQGNKYCKNIWKHLVDISVINNQKIYSRLNITLKKADIVGESFYQHFLPNIIEDLKNKGIAIKSNNATVVFIEKSQNKYGEPFGVIIQKQDGAYLYSSTDIACIKYRCETLKADKIIYYTDSRQKQHLLNAWKIAKKSGYIKNFVPLVHHICGMILEKNGKPFKTRTGNPLKLTTLLDTALIKARHLITNKIPQLQDNQINKIAHIISISAIKYSELSKNRTINYIFNWNNILNFEGNTALYIQYAYVRIFSIIKKSLYSDALIKNKYIQLIEKEEILLATCLLQFEEILVITSDQGMPHILCSYLHKLASLFSSFYEHCPILQNKNSEKKYSRLKLIILTARILKKGLNLLGIKTINYM